MLLLRREWFGLVRPVRCSATRPDASSATFGALGTYLFVGTAITPRFGSSALTHSSPCELTNFISIIGLRMADEVESQDIPQELQDIANETPPDDVFLAPSIDRSEILSGASYSHFSPLPETLLNDMNTECVLGIDEAGRGPVLGIQPLKPKYYKRFNMLLTTRQVLWFTRCSTYLYPSTVLSLQRPTTSTTPKSSLLLFVRPS